MPKLTGVYNVDVGWVRSIRKYEIQIGDICLYNKRYVWMCNNKTLFTEDAIPNSPDIDVYNLLLSGKTILLGKYESSDYFVKAILSYHKIKSSMIPEHTNIANAIDVLKIVIDNVKDVQFLILMKYVCWSLKREVIITHREIENAVIIKRDSSLLKAEYGRHWLDRIMKCDMYYVDSMDGIDGDNVKIYMCEYGYIIHRDKAIYKLLDHLGYEYIVGSCNVDLSRLAHRCNIYIWSLVPALYLVLDWRKINKVVYTRELMYDNVIPSIYRGDIIMVDNSDPAICLAKAMSGRYVDEFRLWLDDIHNHTSPLNTFFLFESYDAFYNMFKDSHMYNACKLEWVKSIFGNLANNGGINTITYNIDPAVIRNEIHTIMSTMDMRQIDILKELCLFDHRYVFRQSYII